MRSKKLILILINCLFEILLSNQFFISDHISAWVNHYYNGISSRKFTIFIYGLLGGFITEETSALAKNLIEFCQYMVASLAPTFVLAGLFTIIELKLTGRPRTKSTYTLSFLNLLISFGGFAVFVFFFEYKYYKITKLNLKHSLNQIWRTMHVLNWT